MASVDEVKKLAALARVFVEEGELARFASEFESILAYVGQLEALEIDEAVLEKPPVRNRVREDGVPHESGIHTDALARQFKERDGDYLKVKKIISHD